MKKLNLGSGGQILPGWDNLDIHGAAIHCDLRKPLPYADNSVSHIFSEHFIEHLDEVDGFNLMRECYRVLIPGGKLRFCCPDLEQYVKAYLDWASDSKADKHMFSSGANFLNYAILGEAMNGIRYMSPVTQSTDHGHRYYYDEREMKSKLEKIGFKNVVRCVSGQSEVPELRSLERRPPMRDLIIEATK